MLTQFNIDARMAALSSTTSDLLVGLKCLDAPEVARMAGILKDHAKEYEASLLEQIAQRIELSAVADDLDAVRLLIPELDKNLVLTRESMGRLVEQPSASQKYARISFKA